MKVYPVVGTGYASGVNRTKTESDTEIERAMETAIRKAIKDGCGDEEMRKRMLEARDKLRGR